VIVGPKDTLLPKSIAPPHILSHLAGSPALFILSRWSCIEAVIDLSSMYPMSAASLFLPKFQEDGCQPFLSRTLYTTLWSVATTPVSSYARNSIPRVILSQIAEAIFVSSASHYPLFLSDQIRLH